MKSIKVLLVISILGVNAVACSDDGDDKGSANADAAAYVTACKKVCQEQVDLNCSLVDLATCKGICDAYGTATGDCATKLKALGDCYSAATDVCSTNTCLAELSAMNAACGSTS